ncbi:hypothetical protein DPMN_085916 [Dreissena polymorpha]|uniref:G-protein coupled receptors family 1 profile domain-containing protein n=1 Tax=Dreissena polymorpha TaxID=45954 RepID=A0A9D3YGM9_DREPO|nr:hypothetical protein DPMN_085916 [Dreissena polymorpha]
MTNNTMSETNSSEEILLEELSRKGNMRHIPLLVYLFIICIFGTFGNMLVFYVYRKKYGRSNCRMFVLCLSLIGLIACAIAVPFECLTLLREYRFERSWACKASVILNTWPTLTAGVLLLCIAVDRYRKVCRPLLWQISQKESFIMCVCSAGIGLAISWISPVIYGIQRSYNKQYNITVSQCVETEAMRKTVFPLINNVLFAVLFFGALFGIITLYCLIVRGVRRHNARRSNYLRGRTTSTPIHSECVMNMAERQILCNNVTSETSDVMISESDNQCLPGMETKSSLKPDTKRHPQESNRHFVLGSMLSLSTRPISFLSRTFSTTTVNTTTTVNDVTYRSRENGTNAKQKNANRTAIIMFQISLAFIASYLPLIVILLIRQFDTNFVDNLSDIGRAMYKFGLRSYYLNFALNPLIYGVRDKRFRQTCKQLLCRCKHK